jgi:hypothetical protein
MVVARSQPGGPRERCRDVSGEVVLYGALKREPLDAEQTRRDAVIGSRFCAHAFHGAGCESHRATERSLPLGPWPTHRGDVRESVDVPGEATLPTPGLERAMLRGMCRNIRPLFNFEPPATDEEVFAAALQYVRKVSNQRKPSGKNLITFDQAVEEIAAVTRRLVDSLETHAAPKNRDDEAAKAKARSAVRFGRG